MRTFIVLIPVGGSISNPRKVCEDIENTTFENSTKPLMAFDVLLLIMEKLNLKESEIEVEPITDFMDRVNNQEFEVEHYFISYVYSK